MKKKKEETSHYDLDILMENTLRRTKLQHRNRGDFYKVIKEVASQGKAAEFYFNEFGIKYNIKDELGMFRLTWIVTNKLSGMQKIFYTRDWVGKTGKIRWRNLAASMLRVC